MSGVSLLHPFLAAFEQQFDDTARSAAELAAGLSETALRWRPEPERWSIEDCLQHLNVSGLWYLPLLDDAIQRTRRAGYFGDGPSRSPWFGERLVRSLEPPPRARYKVPKVLRSHPRAGGPALPAFLQLQEALKHRVRDAAGLDTGRVTIRSPVTPLIRLTVAQAFGLLAAHQRRHLWQAREVRNHAEFPAHA
jgi:hypothetical protein